eukprot:COSAG04_NODE_7361_length_1140_cov_1.920269_1_plen_198_part_00
MRVSTVDGDHDSQPRDQWHKWLKVLYEHMGLLRVALAPPVRTLITYAQVTGQLSHVLHVQYPKKFTGTVLHFKWLMNVWSLIFSPECAGYGSFYWKWVLRVIFQPLLFGSVATAAFLVDRRFSLSTSSQERWNKWRQNMLRATFLCYPSICNVAFSALDCRSDGPGEEDGQASRVLVDDDRIKCGDADHDQLRCPSR